jgi:hypothetical protein
VEQPVETSCLTANELADARLKQGCPKAKARNSIAVVCDYCKTMRVYVDIYVWSRDHTDHVTVSTCARLSARLHVPPYTIATSSLRSQL